MASQCPYSNGANAIKQAFGIHHLYGDCALAKYALIVSAVIGLITLSYYAFTLLRTLVDTTLRSGMKLSSFGAKRGAWALVTGSTDGIGKAFAQQLGKAGFNVLLVSRTQSKLDTVAQEIEAAHGVSTKTVALDFAAAQADDYRRLGEAIQEVGYIGILINNVGVSNSFPIRFQDDDIDTMKRIVDVNVTAQLQVTKLTLPGMLERKHGLILNVSSFSGVSPSPLLSVYSSTKAFIRNWSQALGEELHKQGITVQCISPYFVVSNMSKIRRPTLMAPTADAYASQVLKRIGLAGGSAIPYGSSPYLPHALLEWAVERVLPYRPTLSFNYRMHLDINRRALAKQARMAKKE